MREHETINSFIKGESKIICISEILSRLQVSNIDILIAITHRGSSEPEETFRIGKAASCSEKLKYESSTTIYSIVTENERSRFFPKRLKTMINYISGPTILDEATVMEGDF